MPGAAPAAPETQVDLGRPEAVDGPYTVDRLDIRTATRPWAFSEGRAGEIADFYAGLATRRPRLFNGPVLMADRWAIEDNTLRARLCRTDYASFLFWRAEIAAGRLPDMAGARNLFGAAALLAGGGELLLGRMGPDTANAGIAYPPCGMLDDNDVDAHGRVDLTAAMARELKEETGIDVAETRPEPGFAVLFDGMRLCVFAAFRHPDRAEVLAARLASHLAAQPAPELEACRFVAGAADLAQERCPAYTVSYVRHRFGGS